MNLFSPEIRNSKNHIERLSHNTKIIDKINPQSGLIRLKIVSIEPFLYISCPENHLFSKDIF